MDVPEGLISRLCHLLAFLPFFLLLLLLAVVKAAFIAPIVFVTVLVGNTALILGLYPLHAVWTCYCIARISQVPGYILAGILARPKYRKAAISRSASLPRKHAPARAESLPLKRPLIKTASMKMQELKAIVGFSLTISRMPTFRRRFEAVVKALLQEARQGFQKNDGVSEVGLQPKPAEGIPKEGKNSQVQT
ncbi:hypothetical protein MUK42_16925 [Musa troglodytarum]|uniref:Uncharacterized protein n=1 Tax=Musa troglodytarum TaxID=320322 RepID=A0A9E7HEG4_9LILI|nr:hypothetical protein MUK42_16925 [Musa troglodytarum]